MKITESQLRQTLRQLLKEEVYGTIATVYHGSRQPPEEFLKVFEDESGKVGWQVSKGAGSMYGHGLYTVWMQTGHQTFKGGYGDWIYKFKVNLHGFIIFDEAVCKKVYGSSITPLEQLERLGKKNLIRQLSDRIKESLSQPPVRNERSAGAAVEVSKYIAGSVNGIVFFGGNDGPVVLIYDPNIVTPMAYAKLEDAKSGVWTRWNPEEIRHSRARSAQGGTVVDPERLQKTTFKTDHEKIAKKLNKLISLGAIEQATETINKLDVQSKLAIAQRSDLSDDLILMFANDTEPGVRENIAMRKDLSDDLVRKLADDTEMMVRGRISQKSKLSDDLVRKLANDTGEFVRRHIAEKENLSDDLVRKLADDTEWPVRSSIARRQNLSDDLVRKLADDKVANIKWFIAQRQNLSDDVMLKLAKGNVANVKKILMKRPDLSDEALEILANDKNAIIMKKAKELLQKRATKKLQEMNLRKLISMMIS